MLEEFHQSRPKSSLAAAFADIRRQTEERDCYGDSEGGGGVGDDGDDDNDDDCT